ncbi:MAG: fibrobacter succinogenes major paralogous domain-containing protein [Bacteroidales bacterium]
MKKKRNLRLCSFILIGIFLILPNSCKKESNPVLTTTAVIYITQTTATCGGNITSDGGAAVKARGVCWGTNQTPTIADNKTTNSAGTGSFSSIITGLAANTTYYARAFATNSAGTAYGSVVSFTTPGAVTDIDGNVYNTVVINTQVWMVENLKTTRYRNGDPIQYISDSTQWNQYLTTGAYCIYRNNASNANAYGNLYNWYAVNDNRYIAPSGWHVPTDGDWTALTSFLGGDTEGGKLKEAGTIHWASPNTGATNETGFTALPGGYRDDLGFFDWITDYLYLWSSSEAEATVAWYRFMDNNSGYVIKDVFDKTYGFSVRCIKD